MYHSQIVSMYACLELQWCIMRNAQMVQSDVCENDKCRRAESEQDNKASGRRVRSQNLGNLGDVDVAS